MSDQSTKKFKRIIDQLSPEALEDVLKLSRYLVARQTKKWMTPRQEIAVTIEMLTAENIELVRNFSRDVFYKQIKLEGAPKMDFEKREKLAKP